MFSTVSCTYLKDANLLGAKSKSLVIPLGSANFNCPPVPTIPLKGSSPFSIKPPANFLKGLPGIFPIPLINSSPSVNVVGTTPLLIGAISVGPRLLNFLAKPPANSPVTLFLIGNLFTLDTGSASNNSFPTN